MADKEQKTPAPTAEAGSSTAEASTSTTEASKPTADASTPPAEVGSVAETRFLQERYKDGSKETVPRDEYRPIDFDKNSAHALVAKESFKEDGSLDEWTLRINSPHLVAIFRDVVKSHPSVTAKFDQPFEIKWPFHILIHHWDDLVAHRATLKEPSKGPSKEAEADAEDAAAKHMDLLIRFMDLELEPIRSRALEIKTSQRISFDDLWMIYRPGDVMTAPQRGHDWLLKLQNTAYETDCKGCRYFEVHCVHPFFDGQKIVRRRKTFAISEKSHVPGKILVAIDSLSVFPRSFLPHGPELEERLETRGAKYASYLGTPCVHHNGLAEYCKTPPQSFFHWDLEGFETVWMPTTEVARVVLDPKTFLEDFAKESETIDKELGEDFHAWAKSRFGSYERAVQILSPPFTYGYSLIGKMWCKYFIDNIGPVTWNENASDALILKGSEKALLGALVKSHKFPDNARDVTLQKGKGLVVLLHGTPGSGKTLTAEVSAEMSHSPLMPISLRELYEYQYFDELRLKAYLTYATTWRAVVLIDEADVFLETRSSGESTSADRNALVAVFLRYLEYFSGILFLTSNRVEDFDLAVKSRIHLALQYDPPAQQLRERIWTQRLAALGPEVGFDIAPVVQRLVSVDMNGREISNTINTAATLARSEDEKLLERHLDTVIGVWNSFNQNLAALQVEKASKKGRAAEYRTIVEDGAKATVNGNSSH